MKRVPRKKKKQIPKDTPYCYTPISGMIYPKDGGLPYYKIKTCPFYDYIKIGDISVKDRPRWMDDEYVSDFGDEDIAWCKLVKCDIDDQCKSCGEREGY